MFAIPSIIIAIISLLMFPLALNNVVGYSYALIFCSLYVCVALIAIIFALLSFRHLMAKVSFTFAIIAIVGHAILLTVYSTHFPG